MTSLFWSKVGASNDSTCWPWLGSKNYKGYGLFWHEQKVQRAHRVAFKITRGPIPDGLHVLHSCDNPSCCNPAHLRIGTNFENISDKKARNRELTGTRFPTAKLSAENVAFLRENPERLSYRKLAEIFGVSSSTVSDIINRKRYVND